MKRRFLKYKERTHRIGITLALAGMVLLFLVIALVLVGIFVYIAWRTGLLAEWEADRNLFSFFVAVALFCIVIAVLIATFGGSISLRPVNKVINAMNRLAAGDFEARLKSGSGISGTKAGREFVDSFNTMAEELQGTELLRSDFINNFSHEFKTPIVSINGFARLLRQGNLSSEEQTEYLGIIEEESDRLAQMATNVLNLTHVEHQTILTNLSEFNLTEQIRNCFLLLENLWENKNIDVDMEPEEYQVTGNEELLKQVWVNLLHNAIKYANSGGSVSVRIAQDSEETRVTVANTGSFIPEEQREKIFNNFYQADESHRSEGNGIGLAVVRSVVRLHGGEVSVECEDGETRFIVILPEL